MLAFFPLPCPHFFSGLLLEASAPQSMNYIAKRPFKGLLFGVLFCISLANLAHTSIGVDHYHPIDISLKSFRLFYYQKVKQWLLSVTTPLGVDARLWGLCGTQNSLCIMPFCVSLIQGYVPEQTDGIAHQGIIRSFPCWSKNLHSALSEKREEMVQPNSWRD